MRSGSFFFWSTANILSDLNSKKNVHLEKLLIQNYVFTKVQYVTTLIKFVVEESYVEPDL